MALLNFVRTLLVAAAFAVALAVCATAAQAQEAPPVGGDVMVAPEPLVAPEQPPAPEPEPQPAPEPPPAPPEPVDPGPAQPPTDPVPTPPADPAPPQRQGSAGAPAQRTDAQRDLAPAASHPPPAAVVIPSDQLAVPPQLPAAGAGEDWAWTDEGDAYVFGSGGSRDGTVRGALVTLSGFGSIATAVAGPGLDAREQAARDAAAQAHANSAGVVVSDGSPGSGLFASIFGGGSGGGGAALITFTLLGILAVYRLLPPDWDRAFRTSTATWRPSAYVPPIEHPG